MPTETKTKTIQLNSIRRHRHRRRSRCSRVVNKSRQAPAARAPRHKSFPLVEKRELSIYVDSRAADSAYIQQKKKCEQQYQQ